MSKKTLTLEQKLKEIELFFGDQNLDIEIIYYSSWKDKCVLSATLYLPDRDLNTDLKAKNIMVEEYLQYNHNQQLDLLTQIYIDRMKSEYDVLTVTGDVKLDIDMMYQVRCHTGRVTVNHVYERIINNKIKK